MYRPNMPSQEYWQQRALERIEKHFDNAEKLGKELKKAYEKALKEIQKEVSFFYAKYSKNNNVSYKDALLQLNKSEYKEFKKSIEDYINNIKDSAILKELNALSSRSRISRLDGLMSNIQEILGQLYEEQQIRLEDFLADTYKNNYYQSIYEVQKGIGIGVTFSKIDETAIKEILSYPWSGQQFSERIWENRSKLVRVLKQELTQGFIQGKSVQKIASSINKQMDSGYKNALRLARTETNFIANESTRQGYIASNVVEQYEYLATLDNRTSEVCQSLDGRVFNLKDAQVGVNYPTLHPNCRSTVVVYFDDMASERIARDTEGKNYYVPSDMKYNEWYKKYVA